ncbi:MAG: ribonuclease H-like domain-containing protein [Desulforhabdus sp.]|jgi:ribonuclease D|nr:ribonuclease H-like domain-containing protein [Desulforhabdus sp.]
MERDRPEIQPDLSEQDLERLSQIMAAGVDIETTGLDPGADQLCLIQICDGDGNVNLVRGRSWVHTRRLRAFLAEPSIVKVFHFALFDCAFILRNLGTEVNNVYCTKVASKIARPFAPSHSLSSLVNELFAVELDKAEQQSDWSRHTLTPEQIEYAVNDVVWLLKVRDRLEGIINDKGKLFTGITYAELNHNCQRFLPTMLHLWLNGWEDSKSSIFSY